MTETAKKQELQETEVNPVALAWEHYALKWEADTGRPSIYCEEIAAKVLNDLLAGDYSADMCQA